MGLLDSLLGTHTNAASNQAAGQAQQYQQAVGASNEQDLRGLSLDAQGNLTNYGNQAIGSINNGAAGATGALTSGGSMAQQLLGNGVNNAVGTVQGSNAAYQPYQQNGAAASQMYGNALGLNGAAGNQAATNAFQASPGYQYQVSQATDAASRQASALGMADSGNTLTALSKLGSNLANQDYGSYLDRLSGEQNTGLTANNAVSANNQAAAGYQYGGGTTGASLAQQLGGLQANVDQTQGTQSAGILGSLGSSLANNQTNLGTSLVSNNQWKVNGVNQSAQNNAQLQDQTTNYNNGIYSNLAGGLGTGLLSTNTGTSLKNALLKL